MILRKPYAFFIKHFRLFHFILLSLIIFSEIKTVKILMFYNECIKSPIDFIGQEISVNIIPIGLFLIQIIIIIISSSILAVAIKKEKPKTFYVINILIFIFTFFVLLIGKSVLGKMFVELLDPRILRMVRDLYIFSVLFHFYPIIICLGRATGFNLKKFDFQKDLQELDISAEDREEFELQINYDKNNTIRNFRKNLRFFKYSIKENIIIYSLIFAIILITISFTSLNLFNKDEKKEKLGKPINVNGFSIIILDSYLTNTDFKGKQITKNYLLPVRIKAKNNTKYAKDLDLSTLKIVINNYAFYPTTKYKDDLIDFGDIYINDKIDSNERKYVLVYEIPKNLINKKIKFEIIDKIGNARKSLFKKIKVNLKPKLLEKESNIKESYLNDILKFDDSLFPTYFIQINGISMQDEFKINYDLCVNEKCYPSVEYIQPKLNTNYNKSIMQISGNLFYNEKVFNFSNLYDFIEKFGSIVYENNGTVKKYIFKNNLLKSKKNSQENIYYIEVPAEILNSEYFYLNFNLRNKTYKYILK